MWKKFYKTCFIGFIHFKILKSIIELSKSSSSVAWIQGSFALCDSWKLHFNFFFFFCTGSEYRYYRLFPVGIVKPFRIPSAHDNKWISSLVSLLPIIHSYLPIYCILSLKSEPMSSNRYEIFRSSARKLRKYCILYVYYWSVWNAIYNTVSKLFTWSNICIVYTFFLPTLPFSYKNFL